MSQLSQIFTNIANAIRSKTGSNELITPPQMATAIDNIPSGETITLNTLLPGLGSNEGVSYGVLFLDANLQPVVIEDFETFDFSQITNLCIGSEYGASMITVQTLRYDKEEAKFIYTSNGSEEIIRVSSSATSTMNYPLVNYLTGSFE